MKTALLDVNLLVALFWPDHEHHSAAVRWLRERGTARWATCPLTQLGFIRLTSNPAFSREALTPANAAALLAKNLEEVGNHELWPDDLAVPNAVAAIEPTVQGYR
ncbi:MAG: TA system VapC family ribonuclease toxin, partial [Terriglobales bacterium]